jgi:hypothetical protein
MVNRVFLRHIISIITKFVTLLGIRLILNIVSSLYYAHNEYTIYYYNLLNINDYYLHIALNLKILNDIRL